jgi:hypothetical protein
MKWSSLGNIVTTAFEFGKDLLFGSPASGAPPGMMPQIGATSGLIGSGGSFNLTGFIKKGADVYMKSSGLGEGGKRQGQYFQAPALPRPRSIEELTRGQAVGQVQLSDIQRTLYSMPEVQRAAQMMQASNNSHIANLRAATGVEQTVRQGRKTLVTETPELREIDV